jgi:hypothetical protein
MVAHPFVPAGSAYFNDFVGTDGVNARLVSGSKPHVGVFTRYASCASLCNVYIFARNMPMRFDYKGFHIDCRSRHDQDGLYYAQARLIRVPAEGDAHPEKHESGDIDAFDNDGDAVACARAWALDWCDAHEA